MHETRSAIRYARSFFQLAKERGELEQAYADMLLIQNTIRESSDLAGMLKSPIIKTGTKESIVRSVFDEKIGKLSAAFLYLIVRKRREMHIAQIARCFTMLYLESNHIEEALLITAHKPDEDFLKKIVSLVEANTHLKVELQQKIDASIIGGFILRYGNKQIDASISRELQLLRREFDKNLYIKDY